MSALRKADRRVLGWALAVWALVTVIGFIWAFPRVENSLDESSADVESFTSVQGAELEWNGRDGYLKLPAGTPGAEQIEADLASQSGPRDVQTVFIEGDNPPAADPETDPETETELIPAVFNVSWDGSGQVGDGYVPAGTEGDFNSLFATGDALTGEDNVFITDETSLVLNDQLAPLIGAELPSGRITVDGDDVTITGIATDEATLDRLTEELEPNDTLAVDLTAPAKFNVVWDPDGSTQDGNAPERLSGPVGDLGVADPLVASRLFNGADVEPAIVALAPLIGAELESGQLSVDGDSVVITGRAVDQAAFDRATAALEGTGATVDLTVSNAGQAQGELDELLALDKIEFLTNTAIPTDATEGIIDSVADVLNRFESIEVFIDGHTDSRGSDELNQALSDSRASAVRQGLIDRGIDESRLTASGKGETEPIDSNETSEGRQRNRRVEITAKESN